MNYIWIAVLLLLTYLYTFLCGFNGGNVIATLLASYSMKQKPALFIAAAVQFVAPLFFGGAVAKSIGSDIVISTFYESAPYTQAAVFLCAGLLGCILFNFSAWLMKVPTSSSHALIGGLLGSGVAAFGFAAGNWEKVVTKIISAMIFAPVIAFVLGFIIMKIIRVIASHMSDRAEVGFVWLQRLNMILLAAFQSANESQKSIGIVMLIFLTNGIVLHDVPVYVTLASSAALALGIILGGLRIARTVGLGIYRVKSVHSLSSQLASTFVLLGTTIYGSPVSPSQIVSASIVGVGTAFRAKAVRWEAAWKIVFTWVTTIPVSAVFGAGFYFIMKLIFKI